MVLSESVLTRKEQKERASGIKAGSPCLRRGGSVLLSLRPLVRQGRDSHETVLPVSSLTLFWSMIVTPRSPGVLSGRCVCPSGCHHLPETGPQDHGMNFSM